MFFSANKQNKLNKHLRTHAQIRKSLIPSEEKIINLLYKTVNEQYTKSSVKFQGETAKIV